MLVLASLPASSAVAASTATFSPIARYANPNYLPGAVDCLGSFCMRLDFGDAWGLADGFEATDSVSTDSGATWQVRGAFPVTGAGAETQEALSASLGCTSVELCDATEDSRLVVTRNAGVTWTQVAVPKGDVTKGLSCTSAGCVVTATIGPSGTEAATFWVASGSRTLVRAAVGFLDQGGLALACDPSSRCVLAVSNGVDDDVYASTDLGSHLTWTKIATDPTTTLDSLACPTSTQCVGEEVKAGGDWLATSSDGGASFSATEQVSAGIGDTVISAPACGSPTACVVDVEMFAAAKDTASIYSTTDGGATWTPTTLLDSSASLLEPMTLGAACGGATSCVVDQGVRDGGGLGGLVERTSNLTSWTPAASPYSPTGILSVLCTTASTCYEILAQPTATAFAARIRVSHNDGSSWQSVELPTGDEPIVIGGCQSASRCEVVAVEGEALLDGAFPLPDSSSATTVLLTTNDGGGSWSAESVTGSGYEPLQASCSAPTQCGILAYEPSGDLELLSTEDGTTWAAQPVAGYSGAPLELADSSSPESCAQGGFCLFAGLKLPASPSATGPVVYASQNGGRTFARVASPPGAGFVPLSISCPSPRVCGVLYETLQSHLYFSETTSGGRSWSPRVGIRTGVYSAALACSSPAACVATVASFDATRVLATVDRGERWTAWRWTGPVPNAKRAGTSLFGPLSCSSTVCMTFDESAIVTPNGAWEDLDRALR